LERANHSRAGTHKADRNTLGSARLPLTDKLAALYAQYRPDPVIIDAVNDIEDLTTDLRNKIWQNITILQAGQPARPTRSDREFR